MGATSFFLLFFFFFLRGSGRQVHVSGLLLCDAVHSPLSESELESEPESSDAGFFSFAGETLRLGSFLFAGLRLRLRLRLRLLLLIIARWEPPFSPGDLVPRPNSSLFFAAARPL